MTYPINTRTIRLIAMLDVHGSSRLLPSPSSSEKPLEQVYKVNANRGNTISTRAVDAPSCSLVHLQAQPRHILDQGSYQCPHASILLSNMWIEIETGNAIYAETTPAFA